MATIEVISRKSQEKELRKQMILAAAKELFFEHSYEKTSMDAIAQKVGLAKGTLYLYFSNKDELYISLLIEGIKLLKQKMLQKIRENENYEDRFIQTLVIAFYEFSIEQPQYFSLMMSFQTESLPKINCISSDVTSEIEVHHNEIMSLCVSIVQEGIEKGIIDSSENPFEVVIQIWFSGTGAIVMMQCHYDDIETFCRMSKLEFMESLAKRFYKSLKK
jgi:AcrR family transcriptional regulator